MASNTLNAYSVTIRRARDRKLLRLGAFEAKADAASEIHGILTAVEHAHHDLSIHKKCLRVTDVSRDGDTITGLAHAGEYGTSNPLVDVESGKTTYDKKTTDASLVPFFFDMSLPSDAERGILLSQRLGQSGVKGLLTDLLTKAFHKKYQDHLLEVAPLMPKQAIDALLQKSTLNSVHFIKRVVPADIADLINGTKTEQQGEVEFIVRVKKKGYLNPARLLDVLSGTRSASDLLEIEGFEPETMKAEISFQGKRRTIDFGDLSRIRAAFDISEDVEPGPSGYATIESLKVASADLRKDLIAQLNG